jgi:hypothetical protein
MLKTFGHIMVSVLLLFTTTGLTISKHFCNEYLISTSLYAKSESCCGDDSCCQHETESFQIMEKFQPSIQTRTPLLVEIDLIVSETGPLFFVCKDDLHQPPFIEVKPPAPPKLLTILSLKQAYLL